MSPQTCGLGCGIPPPSSACQQRSRPSFFGKDSNNSLFRLNTTSAGKEQEPAPQPSFGLRGCVQGSSSCSKCLQRAFQDSPSGLSVPGSSCPTAEAPLLPPQLPNLPSQGHTSPSQHEGIVVLAGVCFPYYYSWKALTDESQLGDFFFSLGLIKLLTWISLQRHLSSPSHPTLCPTRIPLPGSLDPNPPHPLGALAAAELSQLAQSLQEQAAGRAGAGSASSIPCHPDSIPRKQPPCEPLQHPLLLAKGFIDLLLLCVTPVMRPVPSTAQTWTGGWMGAGSGMGTHERLLQMGWFASFPLNMLKLSCFPGMMSDLGSLAGFPLQEGTPTTPGVASSGDVQAAQSSAPDVGKICTPSLHTPWEQWQGRLMGTVGNSSQQTPP